MKKSRIAVLALAVAAAGGAFVLANSPKADPVEVAPAPPPPPAPTADVLVTARDIPVGTVLGDGELAWQAWPKTGIAPGMIVKADNPTVLTDIKGSIARANFFQGEPIHREKLIKGAGSGYMSAILPSGKRAVAINIDSQGATSAGGFIKPNDRVDVIRTFQDEKASQSANSASGAASYLSETLLRDVRVLAIGQNVQDSNGQPVVAGSNATLELDPQQAETVVLAQRVGQLSLTLRSLLDANKNEPAIVNGGGVAVVRFGFYDGGSR